MAQRLVVVANANARSAEKSAIEDAVRQLEGVAEVRVEWTEDLDALAAVVDALDDERLVSAGGDGSLSAAVNALHAADRLDVEVAVLPFGTGNDVAGALDLGDLDIAVAAALGESVGQLDLIETSAGVCLNAVHLGIGAEAADRATEHKDRLGALAYPLGAAIAGIGFDPWSATVDVDGERVAEGNFTMIAVANGHRIGGGFEIVPGAQHDDARIGIVLVDATSLVERAKFAVAGNRAEHLDLPFVHRFEGTSVSIKGESVTGNRDGELFGPVEQFDAKLAAGSLRLCLPPA